MTTPQRCRFQYSLRTLLTIMLMTGLCMSVVVSARFVIEKRRQAELERLHTKEIAELKRLNKAIYEAIRQSLDERREGGWPRAKINREEESR